MIGLLTGQLIELTPPQVLINVGGVGYEVEMPISHIALMPTLGNNIKLYTSLVIREDAHSIYGFLEKKERDCFRQLIKVSGIGPKIALALLSTMNSSELQQAIEASDTNTLSKTPGIGKKMAERMILELKGKILSNIEFVASTGLFNENHSVKKDISTALESLGYNTKEISNVMKQISDISDLSQGIKEALKLLNNH